MAHFEGKSRGQKSYEQQRGGGDNRRFNDRFRANDNRSDGSGDQNNNSFKNVRQLCETPIDRSKKIQKYEKGKEGTPFAVIANMFCLKMGLINIFHYDIDIKLASVGVNGSSGAGFREKKMRKLAQKENIEVIKKLANEWTQVFGKKVYVFDGQKNIHTVEKLNIRDGETVSRNISIEFDGFRAQTYEVMIQLANEINMSLLNDFYDGRLKNVTYDIFQPLLQALEIVLRYFPTQTRIPVGRSLYSKEKHFPIKMEKNAMIAFGHYQSVNITEVGPALVVDRSATLFRSSIPLIEFVANIIGVRNVNDLKRYTIDRNMNYIISKQLSGLKIFTKHIRNQMRIDTIDKLSVEKANECKFERDKKDGSGRELISVSHYFKDEYNINLSFGDFPLILLMGGFKRYLPVEVCNVCPEQPVPKRIITPNMTRAIVSDSNSQKPIQRFSSIQENAEMIANESRGLLNAFNLEIIEKPIKLNARKLNPPNLEGSDQKVRQSLDMKNWCFFNISPKLKEHMNVAKEFVDELTAVANDMGITIEKPVVQNGDCNDSETVDLIFQRAIKLCPNLQLLVLCISTYSGDDKDYETEEDNDSEEEEHESKDDLYNSIKYYGDIKYGIITQCINADRVLDNPWKKGYFNNFLLKINSKLGGKNIIINPDSRLPIMSKPLMLVGVDVTHPGSNYSNDSRIVSSIAAVVATYDREFTKYGSSVRVQQKNRKEIVEHFDVMMTELLNQFLSFNKLLPQSIVVFRDGVSEGQYSQVMDQEIKLLLEACIRLNPNYMPKVTVIVVAKRHQIRFITAEEERDKRFPNIPAGTVVDGAIVNPIHREFYLCSHKGMLGTSRPTKYVVLRDDNNMTTDEIQKLCFYLSFISIRSTKSISIPTPVMNAHLAAFRAKTHISAKNMRTVGIKWNATKDEREELETQIANELNQKLIINELVKNKLYYC